jgi:energy-coupling factor transporter transmembrane protein EcfT
VTTDNHDDARPRDGLLARVDAELRSRETRVASLRGAEAKILGRRFWLVAGAIGLLVFAAALVISFVSVTNANARIDRLKAHGIPVVVTMGRCVGNLSGSGSNVAGYQCRGTYHVGTATFHEPIGFKSTFSPVGTTLKGLVDPSHHNAVALASAVEKKVASASAYVAPGILTLVFLALTLALIRLARRPRSRRDSSP